MQIIFINTYVSTHTYLLSHADYINPSRFYPPIQMCQLVQIVFIDTDLLSHTVASTHVDYIGQSRFIKSYSRINSHRCIKSYRSY